MNYEETSFFIMPYVKIYNITDEKVLRIIDERVEKAFSKPGLSFEEKHAIVNSIVSTANFDEVFGLNED